MTTVTEPTKKAKKKVRVEDLADNPLINVDIETLPDGSLVEVTESATDGQEAPAPPAAGEPGFDWEAEYPGEDVFIFTTPPGTTTRHGDPYDGVTVGLAAVSEKREPDFQFLRVTRKKPEFEQIMDMLEEIVASEAALDVLGLFRTGLIAEIWRDWSDWNESVAMGKAQRSTAS